MEKNELKKCIRLLKKAIKTNDWESIEEAKEILEAALENDFGEYDEED